MKKIFNIFNLVIVLIFICNSFFYKSLSNSNNNKNSGLKNLTLSEEGMVPNFQKNIYEYEIIVSAQINKIEVEAIQEDLTDRIEVVGNDNLKIGSNIITINIISKEGIKEATYNIKVIKTDDKESINTNLETLAIENVLLNPPFENDIINYYVEVSNETENLNILAIPEKETSNIEIIGANKLVNGDNVIQIIVTSPNKLVQRIYKVNVHKRNVEENNLYKEQESINNEKLKEIYDFEKVGYTVEKTNLDISNKANGYKLNVKFIILVVLAFLSIILLVIKKRRIRN